ncbi:MAG: hypothetical protein IKS55_13435 [Oscillospiraceae bacterium]|nr:hypothetical protein [Oscillospiraceae bacterium]
MLLILFLLSCCTSLTAFAEEIDDGSASGENQTGSAAEESASNENKTEFNPREERSVLNKLKKGIIWNYKDCIVYIPFECNEDTTCTVYYGGGGNGGWVLRNDLTYMYIRDDTPNILSVWYKNSALFDMQGRVEHTAQILKELGEETGVDTSTIAITSSSNGCYTAIYAASHLISDYGITVKTVVLLDMGEDWNKTQFIITEEEAQPLIDMETTVYHFGRKNDDILSHPGAKQFSDYGVRLISVTSIDKGHDKISAHAYTYGVFSWAGGETEKLKKDYYTFTPVNF